LSYFLLKINQWWQWYYKDICCRQFSAAVKIIRWADRHLLVSFKLEECDRTRQLCIGSSWRAAQQSTLLLSDTTFNECVGFPYPWAKMYAGRVACCPLASHSEYADKTDRQTDRQMYRR